MGRASHPVCRVYPLGHYGRQGNAKNLIAHWAIVIALRLDDHLFIGQRLIARRVQPGLCHVTHQYADAYEISWRASP